jgi:hypothetical protein
MAENLARLGLAVSVVLLITICLYQFRAESRITFEPLLPLHSQQ